MLVYIREKDRERIMTAPKASEIPSNLRNRFEEENRVIRQLNDELNVKEEYGEVYLLSPEIVHSEWPSDQDGKPMFPENFSKKQDCDYL